MADPEFSFRAVNPDQTRALAAALARRLRQAFEVGQLSSLVIALEGGLGAGKTTFSQGFITAWAEDPELYVTSPSFAIAQSYDCSPPAHHLDLYRIESMEDLEAIGAEELYFSGGVALVEWPSRVPEALPEERIDIWLSEPEPAAEADASQIGLAGERADVRLIRAASRGARLRPLLGEVFNP